MKMLGLCCRLEIMAKTMVPLFQTCRLLTSRSTKSEVIMNVFDRKAKRLQRDYTASLEDYNVYEYVKEEIGYRLSDRVGDIQRQFDVLVDLGCGRGYVSKHLLKDNAKTIYQCEFSEKMLMQSELSPEVPTYRVVCDEEFIPFKDNSVDIFASSLSLHWVNDLPGCFKQVHKALKPDGVFLGCMFGGDTLFELRVSLMLAEQEREGGFAGHVSPFTDVTDLGNLLNRAGFTMLTLDIDDVVIVYPTMYELLYDLKGMAENNCAWNRKKMLHRDTMAAAAAIYQDMYGQEKGVPATFQVIYFIGWKPDPSQPKPLERGSGQISIKDIGNIDSILKKMDEERDPNTKEPGSKTPSDNQQDSEKT